MSKSPYEDKPASEWSAITRNLIENFPLTKEELVDAVLGAWVDIFKSKIGSEGFQIGKDIFPQPQIIGFLLHELIPLVIAKKYPDKWCRDRTGHEKDLVCLTDTTYSMEIKTSSHPTGIFGNRSFAQPETAGKKSKSGYYLLVNFQKCDSKATELPTITLIRFAWLDHGDWKGQAAESGQQASLNKDSMANKLVVLYPVAKSSD